eukprot:TRINITY_DN944_c0_g1_i1.p2 TRINITY_DN944_c0_g1~~TRINITY_DN944_c0_g1_i1.p2  ORF type:complete len:74 (-),score=1.74 TRINITY_DN944_c0_g1_i1:232-453(-)
MAPLSITFGVLLGGNKAKETCTLEAFYQELWIFGKVFVAKYKHTCESLRITIRYFWYYPYFMCIEHVSHVMPK